MPAEAIWAPGLRKASPSSSATSSLLTSSSSNSSAASDIEANAGEEGSHLESRWIKHKQIGFTLLVLGGCFLLIFGIFSLMGGLPKLYTSHITNSVFKAKSLGTVQNGSTENCEPFISERLQHDLFRVQ